MANIDKLTYSRDKVIRDEWEIDVDEHDDINNAKRVNIVKGSLSVANANVNVGDVGLVDINGTDINPATIEMQQGIINAVNGISGVSSYNFIQKSVETTYTYYGYANNNVWQIKRKEISTGIWTVSEGTGSYDTAWVDRANKTYGYY